ncbi:DUF1573 domain-containing protein [Mesoterricola silvestris]|uniref:DUF1573 domain-containing protein n=1 Tax=Mesoterricola silvestris TaxID=2927979 RepID=A0AA48GLB9_9BACT|nr:DUF1573 domain-containing protein [Mesoterricola silvestris]BDU73374.1 hypothetical protein METEAL_25480 [Mesoterricola silvestris]
MRIPVLLLTGSILVAAEAPAQPRLTVDSLVHDFGSVGRGEKAVHRFRMTNTGTGTLRILRVTPSCGCTSTVLGKLELAPAETTDLEVTLNTEGYMGLVHKTLEVISNDVLEPGRILSVLARVAPDVTPGSAEVSFSDLKPGDHRKMSLRLKSGTSRPIFVKDVTLSEAPWLGVATRPEGNDLFLDLELLASKLPKTAPSGTDTIDLHVENPRPSTVSIRVRWEKAPI